MLLFSPHKTDVCVDMLAKHRRHQASNARKCVVCIVCGSGRAATADATHEGATTGVLRHSTTKQTKPCSRASRSQGLNRLGCTVLQALPSTLIN
jgi:hypothetical protein